MFVDSHEEYELSLAIDRISKAALEEQIKKLEKEGEKLLQEYLATLEDV